MALGAAVLTAALIVYSSASTSVTPATSSIAGVRAMLTAAVADIHSERFEALCNRYIAPQSQLELKTLGGCASVFAANWASNRHHGASSRLSAIYLGRIAISSGRATFYSEDGRPEGVGAVYLRGHWRLEIGDLLAPPGGPRVPRAKGRLV